MAAESKKHKGTFQKDDSDFDFLAVSKMSLNRFVSHFAPFLIFLFVVAIISGGRELFNDGWKFLGMIALVLALILSIYPWIRDYIKR